MKVFSAEYDRHGSYGWYDERYDVVFANTASEALGLVLEAHSDTEAKHWNIQELEQSTPRVVHITTRCS